MSMVLCIDTVYNITCNLYMQNYISRCEPHLLNLPNSNISNATTGKSKSKKHMKCVQWEE